MKVLGDATQATVGGCHRLRTDRLADYSMRQPQALKPPHLPLWRCNDRQLRKGPDVAGADATVALVARTPLIS